METAQKRDKDSRDTADHTSDVPTAGHLFQFFVSCLNDKVADILAPECGKTDCPSCFDANQTTARRRDSSKEKTMGWI